MSTFNRKRDETPFFQTEQDQVWQKGEIIPGQNSAEFRKDKCGAVMFRSEYGTNTKYSWEIDHKKPVSKGGTDDLDNLQPLQWENNRHKADNYPNWECKIRG